MFRAMVSDRTFQALALAVMLGSAYALRVHQPLSLEDDHAFWYDKLSWHDSADVVILGDSRSHMGLLPEVLASDGFPGRVLNFGFSGVRMSDEYLDAAEKVWNTRSQSRIAVIGVTPQSLRSRPRSTDQFSRTRDSHTAYRHWKARWLGWVEERWPPMTRRVLDQILQGVDRPRFATRHHADGWVEAITSNVDCEVQFEAYRKLRQTPVSDHLSESVVTRVRSWTRQGIRVYGFRPPTCVEMEAIELDFGEAEFIAEFEAAGGIWVTPSEAGLRTFDGSHLDVASAREFSRRLADSIVQHRLAQGGGAEHARAVSELR